jgi:cation diffusion facilitator family transporter
MAPMAIIAGARRWFTHSDIASRAAALSVAANALLMVLKLTVGLVFGSVALLGDGIDSAEDVLASGLAFFTVRLALQPADEQHPYGHGKAESLAALSQGALIAAGAVLIAVTAAHRIATGGVEIYVVPSLIATGISAAANLCVAAFSLRAAKISGSIAIASDARHLLTNVVQAVAVGSGLVLVAVTGRHIFDQVFALLLAAYLLWVARGILASALRELIDTALPDDELALIEEILRREGRGMRGYHELRTRRSGRETYVDLHVIVDPALTVREAHDLVENIQQDLAAQIPGAIVTMHVDPDEPGARDTAAASVDLS